MNVSVESRVDGDREPQPSVCPVCGSQAWSRSPDEAHRIGIDPPEALVRCRACRFAWIDRTCVPEAIYDAAYFDFYTSHEGFAGGQTELPGYLRDRLLRMTNLLGGPGYLLEVGCGLGLFLLEAQSRGWSVVGVESTEDAARPGRSQGIEVHIGDLSGLDGPFDAAHLNHVLEHLEDPEGALRQLARLLRPGGLLAIEVPNELECFYARVRFALLHRFDPPLGRNVHRSFFDPSSLTRLVERAGFEILHLATPRRNPQPDSRFPMGGWVKRQLYRIESHWRCGPNIEIFARCKPSEEASCRSMR